MTHGAWWLVGVHACALAAPAPEPVPPAPTRLVAVGDVHGDLAATRRALALGGLVDAEGHWIGGTTVAVQLGDQLDRGDGERAILDWFEALRVQARAAGGDFVVLLGNHELMNVGGDYRYVTPGGLAAFADVPHDASHPALARIRPDARGRVAAFLPGGPYAVTLSDHPVIAVVGDTVLVHGGVLPEHVAYGVARFNTEATGWLRAVAPRPDWVFQDTSPVWTRAYSSGVPDCARLGKALAALGARRMVVAHTPQLDGISSACEGRVWRIDVGMASHYGGKPAVVEIVDGTVRVIAAP